MQAASMMFIVLHAPIGPYVARPVAGGAAWHPTISKKCMISEDIPYT